MRTTTLFLLVSLTLPVSAWGSGGHYPVDDADIVAPGDFQIESWFSRIDGSNREFAVLPSWTIPGSSLELTAGLYRVEDDGQSGSRFEPAAKWQIAPIESGTFGASIAVHAGYETGENQWTELLVNLPATYAFDEVPVLIHLNLGYLRERDQQWRDRAFVGAGFEWEALPQATLIGQLYREGADADPEAQLGMRMAFAGPLDHLDIALGRILESDRSWFISAGLSATF